MAVIFQIFPNIKNLVLPSLKFFLIFSLFSIRLGNSCEIQSDYVPEKKQDLTFLMMPIFTVQRDEMKFEGEY